jgi:hypothetical protein
VRNSRNQRPRIVVYINVRNVDIDNVVNVERVNEALANGNLDAPGLFPRLEALRDAPAVFRVEMGRHTRRGTGSRS